MGNCHNSNLVDPVFKRSAFVYTALVRFVITHLGPNLQMSKSERFNAYLTKYTPCIHNTYHGLLNAVTLGCLYFTYSSHVLLSKCQNLVYIPKQWLSKTPRHVLSLYKPSLPRVAHDRPVTYLYGSVWCTVILTLNVSRRCPIRFSWRAPQCDVAGDIYFDLCSFLMPKGWIRINNT